MDNRSMTPAQKIKWIGRLEDLISEGYAPDLKDHFERTGLRFSLESNPGDGDWDAWRVHDYIVDRRFNNDGEVTWLDDYANCEELRNLLVHTLLNDGPLAAKDLARSYDFTFTRGDEDEDED